MRLRTRHHDPGEVTRESMVIVSVYDALGRGVTPLADELFTPGRHTVAWAAEGPPADAYFYEIRTIPAGGTPSVSRKAMLLLR